MICHKIQEIEQRLARVCERVGRKREEVLLLGASKYANAEKIREAYQCGVRVFGESRAQDFLKKFEELKDLPIKVIVKPKDSELPEGKAYKDPGILITPDPLTEWTQRGQRWR